VHNVALERREFDPLRRAARSSRSRRGALRIKRVIVLHVVLLLILKRKCRSGWSGAALVLLPLKPKVARYNC
jgi:hypothetical protein